MTSQEIDSSTTANDENNNNHDENSNDSGSSQNSFRVRNISEINSVLSNNCDTNNDSHTVKRKLPNWLFSPASNDTKKAKKTSPSTTPNKNVKKTTNPSDQSVPCSSSSSSNINDAGIAPSSSNQDLPNSSVDQNEVPSKENSPKKEIKEELTESEDEATPMPSTSDGAVVRIDPKDIIPSVKVEKEEATSSTTRDCCKFGILCYRRNPAHRAEMAHPGDTDYRQPDYPSPPKGSPPCVYGQLCYRRNPIHFQHFSHPPSTDPKKNWKLRKMELRKRRGQVNYADNDAPDDSDDPFDDDNDSDEYEPGKSEYETDTDAEDLIDDN